MPSIANEQYDFNIKLAKDLERLTIDYVQAAQKLVEMQSDLKALKEEFARDWTKDSFSIS